MIIDSFAMVGPTLQNHGTRILRPLADTQTADGMIALMDDNGIDRALISAPRWAGGPVEDPTYEAANAAIHDATLQQPDRLLGYVRVNPNFQEVAAALVSRYLGELGFRGLILDPDWDNFEPDDPELVYPLVRLAREHDVPVLVESGYAPASPGVFWQLATDFPETPIILAHMGGRLTVDAIAIAQRASNVYLETSDHMYYIGQYAETVGVDRVLFGTGAPFGAAEVELLKVTIREDLGDEAKAMILSGNTIRLHHL